MNTPAFTRLQRVLDLEERQNWRNRAVVGGLQAMADRWTEDAVTEGVDTRTTGALAKLMKRYGNAPPEARADLAGEMRMIMSGEIDPVTEADPSPPMATIEGTTEQEEMNLGNDAPLEIPRGEVAMPTAFATPPAAAPVSAPEPLEIAAGLGKVYEATPDEDYGPRESALAARARERQKQSNIRRNPRDLQSSVTILPGVGEATAEQLARLEIFKVVDLIWHLPHRYDDFSQLRTIDKLQPGEQVTVIANLWDVRERKIGLNRTMLQGILGDSTGTLHAVWWNKWVLNKLQPNTMLRFSGKIGLYRGQKTIENPAFEELDDERVATGRMSPIYPLTEGLSNNRVRNMIHDVLDGYARFLNDPLPAQLRHTYDLADLTVALQQIHFPDSQEQLAIARRRLAFEELFYIHLGVVQRRRSLRQLVAPALTTDEALLAQFTAVLPFGLTGAQDRVIGEIWRDLARNVPMTRMVQGDVGSGKTAVAAVAMWAAVSSGVQCAMLAPTQILAEQHHRGIGQLLAQLTRPDGTPLNVQLLTGRVTGEAREAVLTGLQEGVVDVVVGTTALIQEGVEFANLGLVVVDEQHRFGVEQRGVLRSQAAAQPHLLVMSATPIPRSLALTLYGDLDLSIIDEMPPGRMPIKTKLFAQRERERLYDFIRREAAAGRQAYIVYPLVDESENLDAGAATAEHKRLQEEVFPELTVALLHGRMTGGEKDEIMRSFAAGECQVLVSTTVIEVGIDVPNATVMLIEDADRFGLAQLHQLRGRVGRGQQASYCALITRSANPDVRERLQFVAETQDGFRLAERDLELRGPGDFFGTRQSGLPNLRVAQLSDLPTIMQAREAAQAIFEEDPLLAQFPLLSRQLERFWRGHGDVS